jgi:signal transduction histidine kinase
MFYELLSTTFRSLRFRLLIWNAAAVALTGLAVLVCIREGMRQTLIRELDSTLEQDLGEVGLLLRDSPDWAFVEEELERKAKGHSLRKWFVRFYNARGETIWTSSGAPDLRGLKDPFPAPRTWTSGDYRMELRSMPAKQERAHAVVIGSSLSFIATDMARIDGQVLGLGTAVLILSPLIGWFLMRRVTQPLAKMIDATSRFRPAKLYDRLEVRHTGDELDRLAQTINGFLDRIAEHLERNHAFLANAAHELRTPLAAIRSSIEVALDRQRSPEEYGELLTDVIDGCTNLETLVNQLLLLAETDADLVGLFREPVDFKIVVEKSLEMFQAAAEVRGLQLVVDQLDLAPLCANRYHLRQLMNNLLDNAIKFTSARYDADQPGQGWIHVRLKRDELRQLAVLEVSDNGVGIGPEHLPQLFERFYRVDRSRTRGEGSPGGSGLGLSIVQGIVAAHEGKIDVRSRPGEGTTFTVRLPLIDSTDLASTEPKQVDGLIVKCQPALPTPIDASPQH